MMKIQNTTGMVLGGAAFALAVSLLGCSYDCGDKECVFNKAEWTAANALSPLPPPPPDLSNKYWDNPAAAALGQKLFFETRYAGGILVSKSGTNGGLGAMGEAGKVGCSSCHMTNSYFIDTRSNPNNVSLGVSYTLRNTPSLVNTVYYDWHGWTGRQDTLWNQSSTSPESNDNTGGDRCGYARMLWNHYKDEYNAIFDEDLPVELADSSTTTELRFPLKCKPKSNSMAPDGNWEKLAAPEKEAIWRIMANYAKAIAAYESQLVSTNSPFDQYMAGDETAISDAAKRGLGLFVGKAACNECHSGTFFTDQTFHNLGVPQEGVNIPREDHGRFQDIARLMSHALNSLSRFADGPARVDITGLEAKESDKGLFRTPTLRGVSLTAPYFHTGAFETLEEVVRFYNEGGGNSDYSGEKDPRMVPLGLTDGEIADIVAFLETLTGEDLPEALMINPLEVAN